MRVLAAMMLAGLMAAASGCAALVVGGAAAGGYAVGKDERPVGQIVDDGTITAAVKTKLINDRYVKGFSVDVDTYNGQVTLTGQVGSYVAKEQAEKLARSAKGVTGVVNNLQVETVDQ